ncbi:hypothetical protein A0U90_12365 [Kozakia baliensis]|uniref:hypothetical protein n=1 Tax=Kozakia baliensis TaxID=153496 RepID=UPI00068B02E0|nr:hypothetical protein [Kozakia baliensis]AOX20944.1 hypothetical protein A0U90_12365 [Kozakia baliensis]
MIVCSKHGKVGKTILPITFPHEQYDLEPVFETTIGVLTGTIDTYRNVELKEIVGQQKEQLESAWMQSYRRPRTARATRAEGLRHRTGHTRLTIGFVTHT